jgi:hypothetical protein
MAVDDGHGASALGDLGLGGGVDLALGDEAQVRDEAADAVRVVPAQVRLDQRVGDGGGAPASSRTSRARCNSSSALWMLSM